MDSSFRALFFIYCITIFASGDKYIEGDNTDKAAAIQFMQDINEVSDEYCTNLVDAFNKYNRDETQENLMNQKNISDEYDDFVRSVRRNVTSFAWKSLKLENPLAYRWFKLNALLGDLALPDEKYKELLLLITDMAKIVQSAKVCNQTNDCEEPTLAIVPDLDSIMTISEDYDERLRVWTAYRDAIAKGTPIRELFFRYVALKNEAAVLNGFSDSGEYWREAYESETFEQDVANLWNALKPFYQQLHAYARKKLMTRYPGKIKPGGPIPAHILGNMWTQVWSPLYDLLKPYTDADTINVTSAMISKGMNVRDMFNLAEEFFTSLGLLPLTEEFWENSVTEKPTEDENFFCSAYATSVCNGKGLSIKMCGSVNMENLIMIHHEMGHIQYFMQYAEQPLTFQNGANPGFQEALGEALALSVMNPKHLEEIGLLDASEETPESDLNFLMQMALEKIAFLPFGYLVDMYRWKIFDGNITDANLNTKWWEIEQDIHGICPATKRTEEMFDAASLSHIVVDYPYISYFVSFIIQFQFHKALCKEAGYTGPLFKCDIYQNKAAGDLLRQVLSKGNSVTWNEAMSILMKGETDKMDASALLEYFQPLIEWLERENAGETIGWTKGDPTICPTP